MRELEKKIEGRVIKWLKKNKIKFKRKHPGELLDRHIYLPTGHLLIIEFKRPGEKLFKRQEREIKELRKLGYDVQIHDDSEEAIQAIQARILETQISAAQGAKGNAAARVSCTISRPRLR